MTGTNTNYALKMLANAHLSLIAERDVYEKARDQLRADLETAQKRFEDASRQAQELSYALDLLRANV